MKRLLKFSSLVLVLFAGVLFTFNVTGSTVSAEGEDSNEQQALSDSEKAEEKDSSYKYTAQPGDSYTKIARKAVQTYGIDEGVNLSQAQIVAAETYITIGANSPSLSIGDSVVISDDVVKLAVEKAEKLDDNTQSLWQKYVKYVNFNTDKVGEAKN